MLSAISGAATMGTALSLEVGRFGPADQAGLVPLLLSREPQEIHPRYGAFRVCERLFARSFETNLYG